MGGRVPCGLDGDISVVAGDDADISSSYVAKDGVINEEVDINIWDGGGILRGIGEVDLSLQGQGMQSGIDDLEVSNRLIE